MEQKPLWLLGAFLSLCGSVCTNFGVNIQKFSQNREQGIDEDKRRPYYKQPYYWMGFFLVALGSFGDFSALGFAAQSVVAPIGSLTLVANILFGHYFLKERLGRSDLIGTMLICVGAALSVSFGSHEETEFDSKALRALYGQLAFQIYAVFVGVLLITLYAIIRFVEPMKQKLLSLFEDLETALKERRKDKVMDIQDEIKLTEARYAKFEKFHPFFYCFLSGVCGGQSLLFAKSVVELLFETVRGENQFAHPWVYIFLFCMFFFIVLQLHFLAVALKYFDALYCVPVFQCFFIIGGTVGGALYFREFETFGVLQAAMFPIGVLVTLTGVYILSKREMTKSLWERNAMERLHSFHLENPDDDEMGRKLTRLGSKTFGRLRSMSLGGSSRRLTRINSFSVKRRNSSDDIEMENERFPSFSSDEEPEKREKSSGGNTNASAAADDLSHNEPMGSLSNSLTAATLSQSTRNKLKDIPESRSPSHSKKEENGEEELSCEEVSVRIDIEDADHDNVDGYGTASRSAAGGADGSKLQFAQISAEEIHDSPLSGAADFDIGAVGSGRPAEESQTAPATTFVSIRRDAEASTSKPPTTRRRSSSESMMSNDALLSSHSASPPSDSVDFNVPPAIQLSSAPHSNSLSSASARKRSQSTGDSPSDHRRTLSASRGKEATAVSLPSSPTQHFSSRKQPVRALKTSGTELMSAPLPSPSKSQSVGASFLNFLNFSPRSTTGKKAKRSNKANNRRSLPFPLSFGGIIQKRSEILDTADDSDSEIDGEMFEVDEDQPASNVQIETEHEEETPQLIGWASSSGRPVSAPAHRVGKKVSPRSMPKGGLRPKKRNLMPKSQRGHRRSASIGQDGAIQLDSDILAIRDRLQRRLPPASLQSAALHDMRADLFTGAPFLTTQLFARHVLDKQNEEQDHNDESRADEENSVQERSSDQQV